MTDQDTYIHSVVANAKTDKTVAVAIALELIKAHARGNGEGHRFSLYEDMKHLEEYVKTIQSVLAD